MKIKGLGRVKKTVSLFLGNSQKKQFEKYVYSKAFLDSIPKLTNTKATEIELVAFVNAASFPDLLLSMLSFINAVGMPRKWTLYADDVFTQEQKVIFDKLPFVVIKRWSDEVAKEEQSKYSKKWQLRKFAAFASHRVNGTTIYIDSDVLFYPLFNQYLNEFKSHNWYLPEPNEANNIDPELGVLFDFKKEMYTVNAGFLIANTPLDWRKGLAYIDYCIKTEKDHYFLDQSAMNLMYYHDKQARVLDPRVFHISANDHFRISALATEQFAIRHYVGLIRHKMWQLGWRQYVK